MPCNSDHMEPTGKEKYLQRTAKLYAYAMGMLSRRIPDDVVADMNNIYCTKDHTAALCTFLRDLKRETFDSIVYNGRDRTSRQLADWYEEHIKADRERIRKETDERMQKRLRKSAVAKLTPAELKAIRRK